mmetsp:Transcript_11080/g.25541  ORF Transcript_11080/g.25541 Transcript_11080/m.25541 type:complete len:231 (+) Transcript_11080:600-1292(+)
MSPFLVMDAPWIFMTSTRPASFGNGISTLRSKRPGRISAGSRTSGRFVAQIILTLPNASNPSSWLRSSMRVRWISRSADVPSENLRPPMASISSMKMMHGWWSLANPNISRIKRALSPMYLSTIADATTFRKDASMLFATALASNVLPVPGGPYKSTPFGALMPTRWKSSGLIKGNSITCATATKTWHASNARVAQNHPAHETKNGPTVQAGVMTSRNSRICSFKPPTDE